MLRGKTIHVWRSSQPNKRYAWSVSAFGQRNLLSDLLKRIFLAVVLVLLCSLVFFYRLGAYALWDPDEGRAGVIAKEILASGEWLTLTFQPAFW